MGALQYYIHNNKITKDVGVIDFVEFYEKSFESEVELKELIVTATNLHTVKIVVNDTKVVFESNLLDVETLLSAEDNLSSYIQTSSQPTRLKISLEDTFAENINIYQKRISGEGDLVLLGYILVYRG